MGKDIGGGSGDFGVAPFHSVNGGGSTGSHPTTQEAYGTQSKLLGDHERGVGKHVSRGSGAMGAQAAPDHGPHMHGEGSSGLPR